MQEMKYRILHFFFLLLLRPNFITSFNCSRNSKEMCLTDCSWSTEENKCKGIQITGTIASRIVPPAVSNNATPCLAVLQVEIENDTSNQDHSLAIGIPVGFGVVIVIAVFIVITITNRRFFMGHMRQNALYVGSVVAEHCVSPDIYRPEQQTSSPDSNNDTYAVVNSIRRPNETP
uniref:Uncharacterized protein LOC111105599 isoform X2 n=1 Tax=Crassostrea virginica TaxID=6565 RepID=A0A8B8AWQ1_CRAVI|nr:uncharacterized protein LOC111105599 isoform X2 [Crassostrea virginica]